MKPILNILLVLFLFSVSAQAQRIEIRRGSGTGSGGGAAFTNLTQAGGGVGVIKSNDGTNVVLNSVTNGYGIIISSNANSVVVGFSNSIVTNIVLLNGTNTFTGTNVFTGPVTLPNSGVTAGSFVNPAFSVNAGGLITAATNVGGLINVRTFGAKGDSSTDDTVAVSNAMVAASTTNGLYFPAGTYRIATNFVFTGISMQGDGKNLSILMPLQLGGGQFIISTNTNSIVRDLWFRGASNATYYVSYPPPLFMTGLVHSAMCEGGVFNCKFSEFETGLTIMGQDEVSIYKKAAIYAHNNFTNNFQHTYWNGANGAEYTLYSDNEHHSGFFGLVNNCAGNVFIKNNIVVNCSSSAYRQGVDLGGNPLNLTKGNTTVSENVFNHNGGMNIGTPGGLRFCNNTMQGFPTMTLNSQNSTEIDNNRWSPSAGGTCTITLSGTCTSNTFINNRLTTSGGVGLTINGYTNLSMLNVYGNTTNGSPLYMDNYATYADGTAYQLTGTAAKLDFGTTDPTVTINNPGRYQIAGTVTVNYNGATFAANQQMLLKIRQTSGTAADITGATNYSTLGVVTTLSQTVGTFQIQPTYITVPTNAYVLEVWGSLTATPSAGSVDAVGASITATRVP